MKQERIRFYHSLYFKISAAFVLLLATVGILEFYIASRGFRSIIARIHQQLEWNVAADAANALQARLLSPIDPDEFPRLIHPYAQINPRLEWYLLEADGTVFAYHNAYNYVLHEKISLDAINKALQPISPQLPLRGQDPFDAKRLGATWLEDAGAVFSVAPIRFNGQPGFLYVILDGTDFLKLIRQSGQFFLTQLLSTGSLISLFGAAIIGFLLFRLLSKRFTSLAASIERYESEDYRSPIATGSKDEIGLLSRTLDAMAGRLVEAKRSIEARDAMRRELIAGIAHDLRSPLQSMLTHLDLANESPTTEKDTALRESLSAALESTLLQKRLVDDLFELSALEAKERTPDIDAISLESLIKELQLRYQHQLSEKQVELTYRERGEPAAVLADRLLLSRVFSNLIDNALRFTPPGGSIAIEADYRSQEVLVSVQDSGPGLGGSEQADQGPQFEQEKTTHRGAGLGLTIVRRIIELHHGELSIESPAGQGLAVRFSLPVE